MVNNNLTYSGAVPFGAIGPRAAILASRILDACSVKECAENLQLFFNEADQEVISACSAAKGVFARVINATCDTGVFLPGQNRSFVDTTYYYAVETHAFPATGGAPVNVTGYCCHTNRVLLNGTGNHVRTFTSDGMRTNIIPQAAVQVAEPVLLNVCLTKVPEGETSPLPCGEIPCNPGTDLIIPAVGENTVHCTLGTFSVVSLISTVQMAAPFADYAVPIKTCHASNDPREVFESIEFPMRKFYPGRRYYL